MHELRYNSLWMAMGRTHVSKLHHTVICSKCINMLDLHCVIIK